MVSPSFILPLLTHTEAITPRYESKYESKIKALVPPCKLVGAGTLSIMASNISLIPIPVLALHSKISSSLKPKTSTSSFLTFSMSAFGKSILLITGIIVRSLFRAR